MLLTSRGSFVLVSDRRLAAPIRRGVARGEGLVDRLVDELLRLFAVGHPVAGRLRGLAIGHRQAVLRIVAPVPSMRRASSAMSASAVTSYESATSPPTDAKSRRPWVIQ
jgi:hypothetical protein